MSTGKHFLFNPNTGQVHQCKPHNIKPNPILVTIDYVIADKKKVNLGFSVDLREEQIANLVIKECERCGLNPYKVVTERRGDFIFLH